ncbi:MAG: hypothetical protein GXO24_04795, partial [Chlorobi bacterium]|nr:hypothetical protein [Chlorobiota bacterium]
MLALIDFPAGMPSLDGSAADRVLRSYVLGLALVRRQRLPTPSPPLAFPPRN